jgi:hypothetical protein
MRLTPEREAYIRQSVITGFAPEYVDRQLEELLAELDAVRAEMSERLTPKRLVGFVAELADLEAQLDAVRAERDEWKLLIESVEYKTGKALAEREEACNNLRKDWDLLITENGELRATLNKLSDLFSCDCDSGFDRPELSTHRQSCILWKVANICNVVWAKEQV